MASCGESAVGAMVMSVSEELGNLVSLALQAYLKAEGVRVVEFNPCDAVVWVAATHVMLRKWAMS